MSERLDQLWEDERNWGGGTYRCAEDPRLIVRGHGTTIYTINAAHAASWGVLLLIAMMAVGPQLYLLFVLHASGAIRIAVGALSLACAIAMCALLANRDE